MTSTPHIRWKLPELLERERVTPNRLAAEIREAFNPNFTRNAIYRFVSPPSGDAGKRPDLDTLALTIAALKRITGKEFTVADLMEFTDEPENPAVQEGRSLETFAVNEAASRLGQIEESPETLQAWAELDRTAKPVRYEPGRGFVDAQ